jgi:hypothetical protein
VDCPFWSRQVRARRRPHGVRGSPTVGQPHYPTDAMVYRPWGGRSLVARLPRQLGGLQDALPEEGEAGPTIALALEQRQTGDLPLHRAIAPS